tara:strand:+ start:916 stop:1503 length:588 start_codon:yes stop_codon:yes gene_type:complete
MESLTQEDYRKVLQQENAEKKFVMARIKRIKAEDEEIAERDNIYNMTLPEFLEWFDANAVRLYKSAAYSRIKNKTGFSFKNYVEGRKRIREAVKNSKSAVSLVRRNSKLRTSFTVLEGPLLLFNSTMLFDHAFTIQSMPHALDNDLKYCIQFSGRFKCIADEFCEDIKSEVVYRALQNVRSTAIYHKRSDHVITY